MTMEKLSVLLFFVSVGFLVTGSTGQLVGGFSPVSQEDLPNVKKLCEVAVGIADTSAGVNNTACEHKVENIQDAKSQVVAGSRYKVNLKVCVSDKCKNKPSTPDGCQLCNVDFWHKPWENFTQVNSFDCKE